MKIQQKFSAFILCAIVFTVVYNYTAWLISRQKTVPSFVFDFEKYIPFLPWTIIPYMTSGLFFVLVFFLCKNREQLKVLTSRVLFVTITAGICFLLFPLKFSLVKPETDHFLLGYSFRFLETFDSPFNQAPSLHIAYAFIFWPVLRSLKRLRIFCMLWLILLGLSTLTTYQHHCIDILSGAVLAHLSFVLFPYRKNDFRYRNFQVANFYFLFGWITASAALLLYKNFGSTGLLVLWPSLMSIIIGYHYQKSAANFLKDKNGSIPFLRKVFYAPYLLVYWILWRFFRKNKRPLLIVPGIYISSRPGHNNLPCFTISNHTIIYDLAAEMEEISEWKKLPDYHSVPFLDIGTPDMKRIRTLVTEITEHYTKLPEGGQIIIHCTMGFTRSSIVGILVMKNILSLPLEEAITTMKTLNKNAVIHSYLQEFMKKLNYEQRTF
ncbi:phosphatase PAP2 family protein [Chryseobacterium indologenes]|uniref:phosphatase PAP2 family protein n=1 Tax=Chryseobacterium indologenes TaxID=253 RepID=UPI000AF23421|nr:phosphatase PAP2 family protein [Chryseobacterium indologenes]